VIEYKGIFAEKGENMDFSKVRVLVTDGGARQTLTILHGLKELGCHIAVLCSSKHATGYVSNIPHEKIVDERSVSGHEEFIPFVLSLLKTGKYDVLLPVAEGSTNKITEAEGELGKYARLACAPRASYINAFDKQRTFELAVENHVPCPRTRMLSETPEEFLKQVEFPLIIKPRNGMGSIGFHKFEKREDFWPYIREKNIDLDTYVLQEFVCYDKRLGTILFIDKNRRVCMAYADEVLRWFPIDAGTATTIRSIDYPEVLADSAKLLQAMNWQGVAALSFMVDRETNVPKLLEINGRIPASIRLSWECGFNVAKLLLEMAYDQDVTVYPENRVFGKVTRHFHAEIPWFIKSPDRFRTEPSWFSWKNAVDLVYWKDDRRPWFAYTFSKILGYKEATEKRKH